MKRFAVMVVLLLATGAAGRAQYLGDDQPPNPEMERQELVNLEKEAGRAIQLNNPGFFKRVYSEDFSGTLSHGQVVNKLQFMNVVQSAEVKYDTFSVSDINVHIYQDTAVATALWSARGEYRGQRLNTQMRSIHVYVNGPRGWHAVSGAITQLPPSVPQPL
jgi:hypothetical protein